MKGLDRIPVAGFIAGGAVLVAAVSASVAPEPALALLGSAAWVVLQGLNGRGRSRAALVPCVNRPPAIDPDMALFLRVRRSDPEDKAGTASSASADNGRPAADPEDESDESEDDADTPQNLSYEEFTARVAKETETEEITFLRPYASGAPSAAPTETGATSDLAEQVEAAASDTTKSDSKMPVPRHFALGTVAVIRKLLEPEEVERILEEQRRYPRLRFGDIAVQLGLLTESQLQEVLLAQQQGVFTDAEIRDARDRLRLSTGDSGDI
jgi:hypothetical protein